MKNKRGIVCVFILAGVLASAIVPGFAYQAEKSNRGAITDIVQTAGECRDTEIGKTKGMGAEAAEAEAKAPDQAQIEGFSLIMQMPELPTGCEITALTMMLDHYGYAVDKTVMASEYLPVSPAGLYYGADGTLYGNDMDKYFIGDPAGENGYICGTEAIVTAADGYLTACGSVLRAEDLTGTDVSELYRLVSEGTPVMVWVTIGMADRRKVQGWYTEAGEFMDWSTNDHGAVLIGYSPETVTIADPISRICEYDREQFEKVFASRGNQCVILREAA